MAVFGTGRTAFTLTSVSSIAGSIKNIFPVPNEAKGFGTDIEVWDIGLKITYPYYTKSALNPESPYLEPKFGQIWPR